MTRPRAHRALAPAPLAAALLALAGCNGADAERWIYWLADPEPAAIEGEGGSHVVVDYSRGGDDASAFGADDVARMATGADGPRPVLAYLSIGEAEDYRDYWDPDWDADGDGQPDEGAPAWLGPANPDWPGNYKVRYWDPDWQALLLGDGGYLDRIAAAGFDGVYLDIVDAYWFWGEEAPPAERRPLADTAADMLDLIDAVAARGRAADAGFRVFPQNGEYVGHDAGDDGMDRLLATVDGIGAEDAFFAGDADEDNPFDPDDDRLGVLDEFVDAGKTVLSVEYLTAPAAIDRYRDRAADHGYHACVARRELAAMTD